MEHQKKKKSDDVGKVFSSICLDRKILDEASIKIGNSELYPPVLALLGFIVASPTLGALGLGSAPEAKGDKISSTINERKEGACTLDKPEKPKPTT